MFKFNQRLVELAVVTCALISPQLSLAEGSGTPTFKVFADYHYDSTSGEERDSAFDLKRSYFGYAHKFDDKFSGKVLFDVGRKDGAEYEAFLKNAYLQWKEFLPNTDLQFGLHGMKQFGKQEKFWGYRYLFKTFMDQNKFGSSADLGVSAIVKPSQRVKLNLTLANGEGYKKEQDDNGEHKVAAGLEVNLTDSLTSYFYLDAMDVTGAETQNTAVLFLGFKKGSFRVAGEYNYQTDHKGVKGKDLTGLSAYTTFVFNPLWEAFLRFDDLSSDKDSNYGAKEYNDGDKVIVGIQYAPIKGVKTALNYQRFSHEQSGNEDISVLFLSVEIKY